MSDVALGVTLPQFTSGRERFADGARRAQEAGLDSLWVFDHMWPLSGGKERSILECWTALAWLAASTRGVGVGTMVTRSSLRHPALLAKMAATVGAIAPGRVTVAIGSGDELSRPENEAFGLAYFPGEDRIDQLASTVEVVHRYLDEGARETDRVKVQDDFVSIAELPPSPTPRPPPSVWVGGRSPGVLEAAGRLADGWNSWMSSPEAFAEDAHQLLDIAGDRQMELSWGGQAVLGRDDDAARDKLGGRDPRHFIVGGPETLARRLAAMADAGARHLVVTFSDPSNPETYELLGGPVRNALGLA